MSNIVPRADKFSLDGLPVEQVATMITALIDRQAKNDQYRYEFERFRLECEQLASAREDEMLERNLDREMVIRMVTLLTSIGLHDQATEVFNNFINNRPRFALEVCNLILKRYVS